MIFFSKGGIMTANEIEIDKNKSFNDYLHNPSLYFIKCEISIIYNEIKSTKATNTTGEDGISSKTLKLIIDDIYKLLTCITNQIISTAIISSKVKIAKVIPVFKKEKKYKKESHSEISNYRPISLLPVIYKFIEQVILSQFYKHLSENELYYKHLCEFRKGHNTELASLELINRTVTMLENKKF